MSQRKTVDADFILKIQRSGNWWGKWPADQVATAVPKQVSLREFLADSSIPGELRLRVALRNDFFTSDGSAERTLRLFACDIAERKLHREKARGKNPATQAWHAVEVARKYVAGEAEHAALTLARDETYRIERHVGEEDWPTWRAARATTLEPACHAARSASCAAAWPPWLSASKRNKDWFVEFEWQCARLTEMIEEYSK